MINPCGHRVLVKPEPVEKVTKSGIILHHDAAEREELANIIGTVVAIGPTAWMTENLGKVAWCKVGDRVAFAKYGGFVMVDPEDGEKYRLINDEDCTCIITGGAE